MRYACKLECNISMKITIYVIVRIWFSCLQLTQDRPRGSYERVNELFFCSGDSYHEFCFTIYSLLYFNMCICWAVYWIYESERCEQHKIRKYSTSKSGLQLKKTRRQTGLIRVMSCVLWCVLCWILLSEFVGHYTEYLLINRRISQMGDNLLTRFLRNLLSASISQ